MRALRHAQAFPQAPSRRAVLRTAQVQNSTRMAAACHGGHCYLTEGRQGSGKQRSHSTTGAASQVKMCQWQGDDAGTLTDKMTNMHPQDPPHDGRRRRRTRRITSRCELQQLPSDTGEGHCTIHTKLDNHSEEAETQQQPCIFKHDGKTTQASATAWPGSLALTVVRWFRPSIGRISSKSPRIGKWLLLVVTKISPSDPWAFVELGTVYVRLDEDNNAFKCFVMAARRGSAVGMLCLGDMLVRGKGVPQNQRLGRQLINKARVVLDGGTGQSGSVPADSQS
mmetsp:Transcript_42219/g.103902  ORF Transcript_42219/g.103902 Transcript_42219/m.103902 type:complete len:281 (+) Transcript_42219:42-884(+)